ncbi:MULTISPECIES: hypothetical protein [unclassified Sphingomonas]|nr:MULTISPECIES: hypothetical protein [unclassified Sphingomonas]
MTRSQVDKVLGDHPKVDRASLNGEEAFRYHGNHVRVVFRHDRAVEVALVPPVDVTFRGRSIFSNSEIWRDLAELDGDAKETLGFIVLCNLGLTLTGFHDGDSAQLAVTAFEYGRWDALKDQMRRLRQ